MPCNSDYMDLNQRERDSKQVALLLVFVLKALGKWKWKPPAITVTDKIIQKAAKDYYGDPDHLDQLTESLCTVLSKMGKKMQDEIIYNGKDAASRRPADWWDEHQKADRARIKEEKAEEKRATLIASAKAKLTAAERKALGL